jgi:hypothetical protein
MLTIWGEKQGQKYCDGVSRRSFLQAGALGIGGLTLADVLRAEAAAGIQSSRKAVINIHLNGGPSHQDIFDLKPKAPAEFRGEFLPIPTNVAGMEICQELPRLATIADKFAVIRSLVGSSAGHSNFQTHTGYNQRDLQSIGGRPAFGSVIAKLKGSQNGAPPYASYNGGGGGYLGSTYDPFNPNQPQSLRLERSLSADRLEDRHHLLTSLDRIRREADATGQMRALDKFTETAIDVVTSGRLADALDLKTEDPRVVARYSDHSGNKTLLVARRLIEVGVRVIAMNAPWGGWDTHANNFKTLRRNLSQMDRGLHTLISDLDERGMLDDVSIVVWGEFGRTPRVNRGAGRDNGPRVAMAMLAGGGMRTGQVIGETTRYAEEAMTRPVHFQEVLATLYHNMGIDLHTAQFIDPAGRPQYLLEHRTPIAELI